MNDEGRWFLAGVLNRLKEITCFLNSTTNSYKRFGMGLALNISIIHMTSAQAV